MVVEDLGGGSVFSVTQTARANKGEGTKLKFFEREKAPC